MAFELLVILLLVALNGVFVAAEIALVSIRRSRVDQLVEEGRRGARRVRDLTSDPGRYLAVVQIGVTFIGFLAAAFAGVSLSEPLATALARAGLDPGTASGLALVTVTLAVSLFTIVFGELVPKRLALNAPERIATAVAPGMNFLSRLASPAVSFLSFSTDVVMRILRVKPRGESPITSDELRVLLHQGVAGGTIGAEESQILDRALRLAERPVRAVMTPRVEMTWLDLNLSIEELREQVRRSPHHRFPAAVERIDQIRGVLTLKDLWRDDVNATADLSKYLAQPLVVPEGASALSLLQRFREIVHRHA